MNEPGYSRFLRALLHLTEPDVMDGVILGFAAGLLIVGLPLLWWFQ